MDIIQAIIVGIVQGFTEFLPISSSAHLIFFQQFLGLEQANLAFDTLLHLGTVVAVVIYFYKDIIQMIKSLFLSIKDIFMGKFKEGYRTDPYKKLAWLVIIGTIPAGLIGVFFKDIIEGMFQSLAIPAFFLLITGILIFVSQRINVGNRTLKNMGVKDTLIIGLAQGLAIMPGISRSGATISAGLLLGLKKEFIAKFTFILAILAILGAALIQIKDISLGLDTNMLIYVAGFIAAAVSGYIAISLLLKLIRERTLDIFAYYCWIVGIAILAYFFVFM